MFSSPFLPSVSKAQTLFGTCLMVRISDASPGFFKRHGLCARQFYFKDVTLELPDDDAALLGIHPKFSLFDCPPVRSSA
jgi:hypothetical protein